MDLTKPPQSKLLDTRDIQAGRVHYMGLSNDRDHRFALYFALRASGHIKLSTKTYDREKTIITYISQELINAINFNSAFLRAYMKIIL